MAEGQKIILLGLGAKVYIKAEKGRPFGRIRMENPATYVILFGLVYHDISTNAAGGKSQENHRLSKQRRQIHWNAISVLRKGRAATCGSVRTKRQRY